jgi:hypothetical protein
MTQHEPGVRHGRKTNPIRKIGSRLPDQVQPRITPFHYRVASSLNCRIFMRSLSRVRLRESQLWAFEPPPDFCAKSFDARFK